MKAALAAFAAGVLFALGLGLAGMTDANKVIGFLDLSKAWDPTLGFVMVGAIGVHLPLYEWVRRGQPWLAPSFTFPAATAIDGELVGGAAIFGVGWALSGFCPGPALVSAVTGRPAPVIFVLTATAAMAAWNAFDARRQARAVPLSAIDG